MFKFFKRLFSKPAANNGEIADASVATPPKPGKDSNRTAVKPISFQGQLTRQLKSDHQTLLTLHGEIISAAKEADFDAIEDRLQAFSSTLKKHLADEFRDLYVYIEYFADSYSKTDKDLLKDFRNEMQSIGGVVTGIINRYANHGVTESTLPRLIEDFNQMAKVLVDRIEREETLLYPLYDDYGTRYADAA